MGAGVVTADRGYLGWLLCLAAVAVTAGSAAMLRANPHTTVPDRNGGGDGWVWSAATAAVLVAGAVVARRRQRWARPRLWLRNDQLRASTLAVLGDLHGVLSDEVRR